MGWKFLFVNNSKIDFLEVHFAQSFCWRTFDKTLSFTTANSYRSSWQSAQRQSNFKTRQNFVISNQRSHQKACKFQLIWVSRKSVLIQRKKVFLVWISFDFCFSWVLIIKWFMGSSEQPGNINLCSLLATFINNF